MNRQFDFERLVELCRRTHEETRRSAARAIDRSLVVRNWLFGWYIVEFEGGGSARRELYGKELIARLAAKLKATGIKGSSPTNLRKCREFYQVFAEIQQTVSVESGKHSEIRQTLSVESFTPRLDIASATLTDLAERFPLGWSHYVNLLSVTNPDARRFYEIEAADNGWSVRELRRQLDSSLYERLALSRDKHDVLAEQLAMVRREVGGVMGGAMSEGRVGGEGRDPDGAGRLSEMPPGCNPASASGARQPPRFEGDWQEGRLRDIAQLHRDHVVPDTTNDTPYAHFSLPAYDAGKTPKIEPGTAIRSGKFRVPNNAVLVSRLNPRIARVWAPALAESNAVASTEFLVLTPRTTATREFLYFLCSSAQFWERLVLSVTGTTGSHQRVNRNDAMTLAVRFPEGTIEQRAIAAVLSDVDELIGSLEALSAKKRDIKQAAMQQLLTGRTRLPGFGGEWETVTLGAIGDTYGGLAGKTSADFGNGGARYIAFLDVLEKVVLTRQRFDRVRVARSESQNRVMVGDVLFNATSETPEDLAMGSMVVVDADELYLNSFCFGYRMAHRDRCDPLFLAYFSRGIPGRQAMYALAQGATRYNLSKKRFLMLQLLVPPLPEQRAIATVLSDMDAEIAALERRLDKTRAIKQGMMQQLLTGRTRLVDPHASPHGESAL